MTDSIAETTWAHDPIRTVSARAAGAVVARCAQVRNGAPRAAEARAEATEEFHFAGFVCVPWRRQLLKSGVPVPINSRAFDILVALLNARGGLVSKDELVAAAWPSTNVAEGNLRVHMAALRKVLYAHVADEKLICTVPGRGYCLVTPVLSVPSGLPAEPNGSGSFATDLPASLTRMFGRDDFVRTLAEQVAQRRFVTIVGPGGIGKTKVAVATARAIAASYPDGVYFVDLTPIVDPARVPAVLAEALGSTAGAPPTPAELDRHLAGKRMLVVLDNCEHLVDAMANLIEPLSRATSARERRVDFLATSREPLRIAHEWVRRLPPLECPPETGSITAAEALAYPSIQLFVDRVSASDATYELADASAATVARICRKLDGIPLAIEMAAGRVEAFGIEGLAAQLDAPLRLLNGGRRTAHARHQTLSGLLDWSYGMLSDPERAVFRRLAIFPLEFSLHAACAVAGVAAHDFDVMENVATLVAKSLVLADVSDATARYRLLGTTRTYALEKLAASGELDAVTRRYAGQAVAADPS
jgi:predicted ATPase/DNA-binding winged helix-turn-helix (wHTH) protein